MLLCWFVSPKQKLVIAIVDKTVLDQKGQEHISLNWILNHHKYAKNKTEGYKIERDYYGFFPKDDEQFSIRGLERFSPSQLAKLSEDADLAYFTDTYGIYNKEWYQQKNDQRSSGILYGGLSNRDLAFIKLMKDKKKLIITEFNTIGSPTSPEIRTQFESLFGMKWSGWTARYFNSLDTNINKELPVWMVKNYKAINKNRWPFKKSGIVFVSELDQIVILEDSTHLAHSMPYILSTPSAQHQFGLPEKIKYPFWFDVIIPNEKINIIDAKFNLSLNASGIAALKKFGIPPSFPAVLRQNAASPKFYYFSGDFCDNPISLTTSYFKGISFFKFLFYDTEDPMERNSFFWNFYKPLITNILKTEQMNQRN
ncbi:hypothetical protein SAMN04489864_102252 [Pedobacter insulae]|uniref:Uncharacterized protein n=2 Tax=Pedobacter insulae TaxID=414048 RepID=A0A1I2UUM2_9SPHI|nr:hypothetical protein SAMN04489864_102252 [Pedobacter insulae]